MALSFHEMKIGQLDVEVFEDAQSLGAAAAVEAAAVLKHAIVTRGSANAILATGNSQLAMLSALRQADLDWSRISLFHMDEYIGLSPDHSASFRRFLHE